MRDTQDKYTKKETILIAKHIPWDEIGPKPDLSNISLKNKQEYNNEHTRYDK